MLQQIRLRYLDLVRRPIDFLIQVAILGCGIGICVSTVVLVLQCWAPVPFYDQWQELTTGRADLLKWLPSQHNEHRILLPRMIFIVSALLDHETNLIGILSNIISQLMLCSTFCYISWRIKLSRDNFMMVLGVALATSFSMMQYENFTWAFQIQFFGVVLESLLLFVLTSTGHSGLIRFVAIIIVMLCTAYTLSSGLISCLIAIPLAVYARKTKLFVAGVFVAFLAIGALYLVDYHITATRSGPGYFVDNFVNIIDYAVVYVGNPFGAAAGKISATTHITVARCAGVVGLALTIFHFCMLFRGPRSPLRASLVALTVFVCIMAGVTAVGRMTYGLEQALSSRYTSPTLSMWTALALLTQDFIRTVVGRLVRATRFALPALLVGITVLAQQPFSRDAKFRADNEWAAIPALAAGVADPQTLSLIYPDPGEMFVYSDLLKAHAASLFTLQWTHWLGSPLADHIRVATPMACHGATDTVVPVSRDQHGGSHLEGWISVPGGKRNIGLLLASPDGVVIGFGQTQHAVSGVDNGGGEQQRWVGTVNGKAGSDVRAYALLTPDSACLMTRPTASRPTPEFSLAPLPHEPLARAGSLDAFSLGSVGTLRGWALADGTTTSLRLYADTNIPLQVLAVRSERRPDVAAALKDDLLRDSGFTITISVQNEVIPAHPRLCLWSDDPRFGRRRLDDRSGVLCP